MKFGSYLFSFCLSLQELLSLAHQKCRRKSRLYLQVSFVHHKIIVSYGTSSYYFEISVSLPFSLSHTKSLLKTLSSYPLLKRQHKRIKTLHRLISWITRWKMPFHFSYHSLSISFGSLPFYSGFSIYCVIDF